jgi:hypothetical protein
VVKIAPGVYTETSPVALKTYVDVEGSGQGVTTITCECAGASYGASAATVSAGNIVAEIRHLTINNTGGDTASIGVYTNGVVDGSVSMTNVTVTATGGTNNRGVHNVSSSPSMMNVTATATGTTGNTAAVFNGTSASPSMMNVTATATGGTTATGVYNGTSSPSMMNVTATATGATNNSGNGRAVFNVSSSPSMTNVTTTATGSNNNYGMFNQSSASPSIRKSSLTGDDYSIYNADVSLAQVADTMLDGPLLIGGGLTCVGAYDANFVALNASCS